VAEFAVMKFVGAIGAKFHLSQESLDLLDAVLLLAVLVPFLLRFVVKPIKEYEALSTSRLLEGSKMAALGEMAGGISHEVNNPLTVILGKVRLMRAEMDLGQIDSDKLLVALTKIETAANRILKIVKGLRSFSRNSEGDPFEVIQVSKVIEETLDLCREKFRNHSVDVKVVSDQNVEPSVKGRSSQLMEVLLNLLQNAFDAITPLGEKWIEIQTNSVENLVLIRVTDSGFGIPVDVSSRIMQPFFTTKEVGKGTGLGLSLSKGIIENHGGKLYYDKNFARTSFVIELPQSN
ncbi:ATP-binding protein, partial [Bdellovibrionota bacterium FG-2]